MPALGRAQLPMCFKCFYYSEDGGSLESELLANFIGRFSPLIENDAFKKIQ